MAKILAVDDQLTIRELISVILQGRGHSITTAEDGLTALEKVRNEHFDLVITDINMPKMDGYAFVAKVRQIPEYKYIPILMLTTESREDRKANAKMVGASGWLTKPFDSQRLSGAVTKLLAKADK